MKRLCLLIILLSVLGPNRGWAAETVTSANISFGKLILDQSKSNADREAIIAEQAGRSAVIVTELVSGLNPGGDEEYVRIPWIWRVAVAAGKRNDLKELKALLDVSVPKNEEPLHDWQAVVIGGGIINGITLQGDWPGDRIHEMLRGEKNMKARWQRVLDLSATMADNEKTKSGTRYDALRIIALDTWERRGAQLMKYLQKGVNGELQQGAISGLADMKSKDATAALIEYLPNFSDNNRGFALDGLLRDENKITALLDGIAAGKIQASTLGEARLEKLRSLPNKRLRTRAEKLLLAKDAPVVSPSVVKNVTSSYFVGVAKIDVTPSYPVRLHGYLGRTKESEGVIQHIFAKALAFGTDKQGPAILLSVDNCMVPEHIRNELLKRLSKKGITSDKFTICSSHTHSAPKLAGAADNIFGADIPAEHQAHIDQYTKELTDLMEQVAVAALKDRRPSELSWGKTKADFAENRRTKGGPVDHDLPVLKVTGADGKVRALLLNYACHCTTMGAEPNHICGDWAGYAQEGLEQSHPGIVAMTVIGCGADANPQPRPGVDFAKQHGQSITTAVDALLTKNLTPLSGALECRTKRILLPFDKLPTREEWEQRAAKNDPPGYQAKRNLERLNRGEKLQTELPYLVQEWNFGNQLALIFLPGEVVVDYSLRLKNEYDSNRLWVTAYANDVPCYIPSKRIWNEGGYEGAGAMVYYDRPTRLAEQTEELIVAAVKKLMPKDFVSTHLKSEVPDPKSPAEVFETFQTKPGFIVDLVAYEPLIVDPVAIDFATDGKLWVAEMHDYPSGLNGNFEPGGRVKLLEDTNGDGEFDKSSLFIDGLPFPTGLMQWRDGVLICAAPDILYAEDRDGDGKAEIVEKLFTGFVTHNYQARINSLRWGLDNWIYAAGGLFGGKIRSEITGKEVDCSNRDIRFNPDTGEIEPVGGTSQQGRARDDWDNWFGCDNSNFLWHFPLPDRYVRRNPHVTTPEPRVHSIKSPEPNLLFPVSKTQERFNNPNSANRTTSASGIEIYRDDLLGKDFYGNSFTGETVHNLIQRFVLTPDGATFAGHRATDEQKSSFFASTDNWCRPVEVRTGPDGALWIVDMYRAVIEHPRWIPADRLAKLDVRAGEDKGRIYRVYPVEKSLRPIYNLTKASTGKLVSLLDTSNGPTRDLVHRELFQRRDKSAQKSLKKLSQDSRHPAVRAQALCVLEGLNVLNPEDVVNALDDSHPGVRRNAVRLGEEFLSGGHGRNRLRVSDMAWNPAMPLLREKMVELVDDPIYAVRFQVALSLGEWADPRAGVALGELARKNLSDQWMRAAILSSASRQPAEILEVIITSGEKVPGRAEMIGQLMATAAGAENPRVLQSVLVAIAPKKGEPVAPWRLIALANIQDTLERKNLSLDHFKKFATREVQEAIDQIQATIEAAGEIAQDKKASVEEREAAVRLLDSTEDDDDIKTLVEIATGEYKVRLQKAAQASLRRVRHPKLSGLLMAGWKNYLVGVRPTVIDILLGREEGIQKTLDAVQSGVIAVSEIPASDRQRLLAHENEKIKNRSISLFPQNEGRKEVLAKFTAEVPKLTGHPDSGGKIFGEMCASCHAFRGQGIGVGPDLAPLTDKSIDDFLLAILDPNSVIEPRFIQYNIDTRDDRSISGVVGAETATSVTLTQAGGVKEKILRSDISQMKASSLSLMPEGLEEGRTAQDLADLIAYLKTRAVSFGSASPSNAAAAKKKFTDAGANGIARLISATETLDYPSWIGTLPLAHCRQTDGKGKVAWDTAPAPAQINATQLYIFRVPIAMGFYSNPAGKFTLHVNGKAALDFNVTLADYTRSSSDGKISMRYQVMENNAEDSNGILTISIKGELLEANKPVRMEVTGSAAESQRWFGIYLTEPTLSSVTK